MKRRQAAEQLAEIAIKSRVGSSDPVARECLISEFDHWLGDYDPEWEAWDGY